MIQKLFSIAVGLALAAAQSALAQGTVPTLTPVGAAGAVAGRVTALAPASDAVGRVLSSGKTVYSRDTITTSPQGRLQIMLVDETVFTIGPDSEMLIDEFVYDPFTGSGKVAAEVTKGVFRFVTGKIARKRPSAMKVKLPNGTIGIRGTIVAGKINADESILVALLGPGVENSAGERPGSVDVVNAGRTVSLVQTGFAALIRPGQAPTPPFRLTPEQIRELELKPVAQSGGGDPANTQEDAKKVGDLGTTSKISDVVSDEKEQNKEQDQFSQFAAQQTSIDDPNIINWSEFIARAPGSGTASYSGSGTYSCTGGVCGASGSGNWEIHFQVDWGNRTLGGSGASSHVAFSVSTGGPLCANGCSAEYDSRIPVLGFSQLSGDAKLVQGEHYAGTNAEFDGSGLQFNNTPNTFTGTLRYVGQGSSANAAFSNGSCSGTCPN